MEDWPTSREHIEVISATEKGERADHRVTIAQGLLADKSGKQCRARQMGVLEVVAVADTYDKT